MSIKKEKYVYSSSMKIQRENETKAKWKKKLISSGGNEKLFDAILIVPGLMRYDLNL